MKKNIAFSENLKRLRKEAGLSRHTLSEMICYSEKSVEKWESAHATPPLSVICRLSEIFAVSLDSLIYADKTDIEYYYFSSFKIKPLYFFLNYVVGITIGIDCFEIL